MRKLGLLTATAALAVVMGFSGTAKADPWGDAVTASAAVSGTLTDVLGAPDQTFIQIPDTVSVTVEFTNNSALGDGSPAADLSIDTLDTIAPGAATIEVSNDGLNFTTLTPPPLNDPARGCAGPGGGGLFCNYDDLGGAATGFITFDLDATGLAFVTHVRLTDLVENIDDDPNAGAGFDLDAVVALSNFDLGTTHIQKNNIGQTTIEIQAKGALNNGFQFFSFNISIVNGEGEDLTDIVFEDVLPAEFDLNGLAEDVADGSDVGSDDANADGVLCADGACDGVRVITDDSGTCTASGAEHTNQGKSGKPKLQPEVITITDTASGTDDICEVQVYALTDDDHPGKNSLITPTGCNEGSFIFLNEGVEVIDTMGTGDTSDDVTVLIDDDRIELVCTGPTFD